MADFSQYAVNLDTPQPGGRQGESPRSAFTKYNDLLGALEGELEGITYEHISATVPVETYPFQPWVDTGVNPPMLRRRNAGDDAWVAVMPALVPLGTASQKDLPSGVDELGTIVGLDVPAGVDEVYHHLNVVGTVSESGGVPTGALLQAGSNSNGTFFKFAGGLLLCFSARRALTLINASNLGTIWTYPSPFYAAPNVYGNIIGTIGTTKTINTIGGYNANASSATVSALAQGGFVAGDASNNSMDCFAIGRWHA